jgi:hypothetical protein
VDTKQRAGIARLKAKNHVEIPAITEYIRGKSRIP